ncbi:thiamine pyrophosphate-dependent dehydrogenase E1 component subunit alpha [Microvirga zambiensis]|uniref:thiamine pyrophosphate-dependent dehydrogenase E1 component subunit alpha n=1 Tax=Microvirga zambiensis TaxID=1402137 RepID=UPI00191E26A4|nr:thiamine pyrophosphate-dependent dehydrogenase E1 component subunit alpha [Microvirga zambiensis]
MDRDKLTEAYRLMLLSRAIDEKCTEIAFEGVAVPNYHGARGQEALYAGVGLSLQIDDQLLYNYRAFATLLAKGVKLEELVADLLMNANGTSRGHGGIMHVTAPERGIPGRNGVFGSKFGIALGLAQALVLQRRKAAVVCMFGEAEGNRGGLYEALNIAALRQLPIVFIAENNGYAVAAPTSLLYSTGDMSGMMAGFPMPVLKLDGNDVEQVGTETERLVERARDGGGPAFVECVTVRLDPHHLHDDQSRYRDSNMLDDAWKLDPMPRARARLLELGLSTAELEREEAAAVAKVGHAFDAMLDGPPASLDAVFAHTYFDSRKALQ